MRRAILAALAVTGCAAAPPPPVTYSVPPSLGPRTVTEWQTEPVDPRLTSPKGLTKNQATTFLYEDDRVYSIKACAAGRFTTIKLPAGEELTGDTVAAFGDADPLKWGIYAKKGGKGWVVSVGSKVYGLETSMTITTNVAAYIFDITGARRCQPIIILVHPKRVAVKREVPADYSAQAINANYTIAGDAPWRPIRAFDMGTQKIWVEFPGAPGAVGAPAVLANGSPITPRIDGNFYQVDTSSNGITLKLNGAEVTIEKGKS